MNNGRDGMSCTLYGSSLVLYGGHPTDASLLWHLDLLTLEWRTEVTTGAVPPKPIAYHAATITEGTSFIMGGGCSVSQSAAAAQSSSSMIEPLTTVPYAALRPMVLRQLDLSTLTWSVVPAAGEVPTDRSHHTFTADGAVLYLIGGKPLTPHGVTSRQFDEFVEMGFFDVFCFSTRSGIWQRVRTRPDDPLPTPRLWGHCAVLTAAGSTGGGGDEGGRKQLLLHGGLEMELVGPTAAVPDGEFTEGSERHDDHDDRSTRLPSAHFNQSIYLTTCPELRPDGATVPEIEWGAFHPQPQSLQPTARALHCAVLLPSSSSSPVVQPYDARCLYVLGGFTLTPAGTVRLLGDDFWRCETSTGLWRPTSHYRDVLPNGGTEGGGETSTVYARPLFAVYGATLVVLCDDWKAVRLFDGSTWSEMHCDGRQLRLHEPLISHNGASADQGRSSLGDTDIESRQQDTPNRALLSPSPTTTAAGGGGVGPGVTGSGAGGDGGSGRSSRRRGASSAKVQSGATATPNNKKQPQSSALQHLPPALRNATPVIRELLMELPVVSIPLQDHKSWGQVYGEGPSLLPQEVVKLLEENSSYQRLMQWRPALLNETTTAERK